MGAMVALRGKRRGRSRSTRLQRPPGWQTVGVDPHPLRASGGSATTMDDDRARAGGAGPDDSMRGRCSRARSTRCCSPTNTGRSSTPTRRRHAFSGSSLPAFSGDNGLRRVPVESRDLATARPRFIAAGRARGAYSVPAARRHHPTHGVHGRRQRDPGGEPRRLARRHAARRGPQRLARQRGSLSGDGREEPGRITLLLGHVWPIYRSPGAERLFGYSAEARARIPVDEFVLEQDRPRLRGVLQQLLARPGESIAVDFGMRDAEGKSRWVELTATNLLRHRRRRAGRELPRHHRPQDDGGPARAVPEDGSRRPSGRGGRPRLQQHAHRDQGCCEPDRERARRRPVATTWPRSSWPRAGERAHQELLAFSRRQVSSPRCSI